MSNQEMTELEDIKEQLGAVSKAVQEIAEAILGTKFNENAGFKYRLEQLEKWKALMDVKVMKAQIYGTATGALAVALIDLLYKLPGIITAFGHK
jgi:hypothetical protein